MDPTHFDEVNRTLSYTLHVHKLKLLGTSPRVDSLPYAVRFRQCLVEYLHPTNESRRPLYNALKYASSFPVIYLSAAQRIVVSELLSFDGQGKGKDPWRGEQLVFRLWSV